MEPEIEEGVWMFIAGGYGSREWVYDAGDLFGKHLVKISAEPIRESVGTDHVEP